jgi:hypothetical protein
MSVGLSHPKPGFKPLVVAKILIAVKLQRQAAGILQKFLMKQSIHTYYIANLSFRYDIGLLVVIINKKAEPFLTLPFVLKI